MKLEHPRLNERRPSVFRRVLIPALFFSVMGIYTAGCDSNPRLPTSTSNPDTTGNGGGGGGGGSLSGYGTLFFQSGPTTPWVTELSASTLNGVLLAENESADTIMTHITYDGRITFGEERNLSFVWRGGVSGNTIIYFHVSSDGVHWQNAPYHPDSDWQVAPHVLFSSEGIPLTFRFEFVLPPGGRARITEVRAYGK